MQRNKLVNYLKRSYQVVDPIYYTREYNERIQIMRYISTG